MPDRILIVDDEAFNLDVLESILDADPPVVVDTRSDPGA